MPLCGHPPSTLLSYASCTAVLAQLMRITEPEAWATPDALATVPFDLPDDCDPRPGNIWTLYADDYCGWECRNNAFLVRRSAAAGSLFGGGDGDLWGPGSGGGEPDFGCDARGLLSAYMPGDEEGQCVSMRLDGSVGAEGDHRNKPLVLGMPDARYGPGSERLGIGWRSP
ncbi:unnamed protein product [Discula destructiva]